MQLFIPQTCCLFSIDCCLCAEAAGRESNDKIAKHRPGKVRGAAQTPRAAITCRLQPRRNACCCYNWCAAHFTFASMET